MRILITGGNGQLGSALAKVLIKDELDLVDRPQLDLASFYATRRHFKLYHPELVIHCAAQTNVDYCELHPDRTYRNNVTATRNVVNVCQRLGAALVYISTDYVFDGQSKSPYREYEPCNPVNIYGMTKYYGEQIVQQHLTRFYIVRTAWLFGDAGANFVKAMLEKIPAQKTVAVVDDQIGSPTYATDLAQAINRLIRTDAYGIYHITNSGSCSWYQFARAIAERLGEHPGKIKAITSTQLNRPAPRPQYSVLKDSFLKQFAIGMPTYQDALDRYLQLYLASMTPSC